MENTSVPGAREERDSRRKVRNFLLRRNLQLKLPASILIVTLLYLALMAVFIQQGYGLLYEVVLEQGQLDPDVTQAVRDSSHYFLPIFLPTFGIYCCVIFVITTIYTHRLIGPTVAMKRHLEALIGGDYSSRVKLRKSDAFGDLAHQLNALAASLEEPARRTEKS